MGAPILLLLCLTTTPFDGVYETTYGRMRFHRDGDRVEGTYAFGGGSAFTGAVARETAVIDYREPNGVTGRATLTAGADGDTFIGTWNASDGNGGTWEGDRVEPESGLVWLVVLESPWEESYAEREYSFGEMLRAYFARFPQVEVRHRRILSGPDLLAASRELTYLVEPVVLLIGGHGDRDGLILGERGATAEDLGAALAGAFDLRLVHFSSCSVLEGDYAVRMRAKVPVSGYSEDIDWTTSALAEFLFLEYVIDQELPPAAAAARVREEFLPAATLRVVEP